MNLENALIIGAALFFGALAYHVVRKVIDSRNKDRNTGGTSSGGGTTKPPTRPK